MAEYTKEGHVAELRQKAVDAKAAGQDWERRWYLSLSWGNGAALAATGSGALTIINSPTLRINHIAPLAVAVGGWFFFVGLLAGASIPYCWKQMVHEIPDWASVREDEVLENREVDYHSDDGVVFSSELLDQYAAHEAKWRKRRSVCETTAVTAFAAGVAWILCCLSFAMFVGR